MSSQDLARMAMKVYDGGDGVDDSIDFLERAIEIAETQEDWNVIRSAKIFCRLD